MLCKDCKHSEPSEDVAESLTCVHPKFLKGYNHTFIDVPPDGIWLEGEWGWVVGPEFGCIHWESKP
jgi:hypothetical protein